MSFTPEELQNLLSDIESDRVERTVSINKTDKFGEAICAFSNDFPSHHKAGYLLVGVRDNGVACGLQVTDQLLQNLAALRSDGNIQPLPSMTVQKYSLAQGDIAVVEVLPADLPPVRYKGRVYIRVGPRKAIANEAEERILSERRTITTKNFDAHPCQESSLHDLSLDLFRLTYLPQAVARDVLEENHRSIKEQLASLRFYDLAHDCPTHAGMVLFAKNPLHWMPGAYIQFLRLAGNELTDEVHTEHQLSGDLLSILRKLDELLDLHNTQHLISHTTLREQSNTPYPKIALRELLMNAVAHRQYDSNTPIRFYWFSDRIEIQNPGGLYGESTPDNFPKQNSYRNPVIAEALKTLGYVNKFGRGVLRAQQALEDNGNPPAEFELSQSLYFTTTIRPIS